MVIDFRPPFGPESYRLFLDSKRLPESVVSHDWRDGSYRIEAPARYAGVFGMEPPAREGSGAGFLPALLDRQLFAVRLALRGKRFAVWYDTGLGKTLIELEFARHVQARTGGRVLIITPLNVMPQFAEEAARFYGDSLRLLTLRTGAGMRAWARHGEPGIALANPEKFLTPDESVPEAHYLSGVVLDESSLLKASGGRMKWSLIKSCRGIEYKLSCTATPAPNDTMEYASQASWLERISSDGEVLWTFFRKDGEGGWHVKPHARPAFYRFLAGWSLYMRDPAAFGFRDDLKDIPDPETLEHHLGTTPEQEREALTEASGGHVRRRVLLDSARMDLRARTRCRELAAGFLLRGGKAVRVPSLKPPFVARLAREDLADGRQVLIWTKFDEEGVILGEELRGVDGLETLSGKDSADARAGKIERFRKGATRILISKPELLGYGLNFQQCSSVIFSGFDDSYERFYQAMRRVCRYGQRRSVRVHTVIVTGLEDVVYANVRRKEARVDAEVRYQEMGYREAMRDLYGFAGGGGQ